MGFSQRLKQLTYPYQNARYIEPDYGEGTISRIYLHCQNFVYRWCKQIIALGALSAIVFGFVILIIMIKYANDGSNLDSSNAEFALYKNTFYSSCPAEGTLDCSIQNPKTISGTQDSGTILYWDEGISQDDFCACFEGSKVVPSDPRQSAFGYNGLSIWLTQTVTLGTGLWILMSFVMMEEDWEQYQDEIRIPRHSYALFLYDIAQFIMWWVGFIKLAHSPSSSDPVAILSWITAFRYIYALSAPPLSNRISGEPGRPPSLIWVIVVITVIQWVASAATIGITHALGLGTITADTQYVRYDFQISMYDSAPGLSSCSAEDIQAMTGLFTGPPVGKGQYSSTNVAYIISFVANSIAAAIGGWRFLRSTDSLSKGLGATLFTLTVADYIIMAISISPTSEAVSTILRHDDCNVIHITMSPNKGYMDVSGFAKGWRAVKGWFSV